MKNDLQDIKKRLREEDKVREILEAIGCEHIKDEQGGYLITAQLPEKFNSGNKRAVQVRMNEKLTCYIRNKNDFEGDIFSLISYIHHDKRGNEIKEDLYEAKTFICQLFGWNEFLSKRKKKGGIAVKKDYAAPLKEIIKKRKKKKKVELNPVLPEEVMNEFYFWGKPLPYKGWIEEGISYETQVFYGVGFDLESKRIVFPVRDRFGRLIGVKGRILKEEDAPPEMKYLYLYPCRSHLEWFNFYFSHKYILLNKKVYIFEAEKSCFKAHSLGIYNTVAIGSSNITEEQVDIIKSLGLDIEIVLCYDKDKTVDEIKKQAEKFKGRKVFAMYDVDDKLEEKDSPMDRGIDVWNYLVKNNIYEIKI